MPAVGLVRTSCRRSGFSDVERAIALFLDVLRKSYAVGEVHLYGSRARGDLRPDSDADLAIVLHGPRGDIWDTAWTMSDITFDLLLEGVVTRHNVC